MNLVPLSLRWLAIAGLTTAAWVLQTFAGPADRYQSDISPDLVAMVDDAKQKQINGMDLDQAAAELQQVLNKRPDYYRALFNLGLIYQSEEKTDLAVQYLSKAKQVRDDYHIDDSSILNSLGWAQMQAGKLDDAERNLLEAVNHPSGNKSTDERALNNLGYVYLQKGQSDKARTYLNRSRQQYQSDGASKILALVDDYDQNQRKGAKEIPALIVQIDDPRPQVRQIAVNALAFDSRYAPKDVVDSILQRLESASNPKLSVQGEINCLIILSRRNVTPWTDDQVSRAKALLTTLASKDLSSAEQWAVRQLDKTLQIVQPTTTASPSG
jgi:Tfp pilus assembly protein PilF